MIRTRKTITIDKPVDQVFDYMAHFENDMEWRSGLLEVRRVSDVPEGSGAEYFERLQWEDYQGDTTVRVTDFEPTRRIAYDGSSGDVRSHGEYAFRPENGRTRVDVIEELELQGRLAGAEEQIGPLVQGQVEEDLVHLKDILEHRG